MQDEPLAAYVVDGRRVLPTARATGPWYAGQQHGAAVMALLARFLEQLPSAVPMRFSRITADLSRAVPMTEIEVTARALRDGRRVQSLEATISAGGDVVARAVATRVRVEPGLLPPDQLPPTLEADATPPFDGVSLRFPGGTASFHDCLEVRVRQGVDDYQTWYRLTLPLVAGEQPSPLVRMAATADMIMSGVYRLPDGWISINPEVMLQIERSARGEWLCVRSDVRLGDDGVGMSSAVMYDRDGRVGSAAKTLLNTPRAL